MHLALTIAILAAVWVAGLLVFLRLLFSRIRKKLKEVVDLKFRGREILLQTLSANFFGQRSKGAKQVRGNGALVLTNDELWFLRAYPVKEFSIPLKDVASVSLTRSHLGKTVGRDLLFVEYATPEGDDAIAWAVCDPENWKDAIEKAAACCARA